MSYFNDQLSESQAAFKAQYEKDVRLQQFARDLGRQARELDGFQKRHGMRGITIAQARQAKLYLEASSK